MPLTARFLATVAPLLAGCLAWPTSTDTIEPGDSGVDSSLMRDLTAWNLDSYEGERHVKLSNITWLTLAVAIPTEAPRPSAVPRMDFDARWDFGANESPSIIWHYFGLDAENPYHGRPLSANSWVINGEHSLGTRVGVSDSWREVPSPIEGPLVENGPGWFRSQEHHDLGHQLGAGSGFQRPVYHVAIILAGGPSINAFSLDFSWNHTLAEVRYGGPEDLFALYREDAQQALATVEVAAPTGHALVASGAQEWTAELGAPGKLTMASFMPAGSYLGALTQTRDVAWSGAVMRGPDGETQELDTSVAAVMSSRSAGNWTFAYDRVIDPTASRVPVVFGAVIDPPTFPWETPGCSTLDGDASDCVEALLAAS